MDISQAISVVFPVLVIVIGGVCVLLLGSQKALRDSNKDLRDRTDDQDRKIADQASEIASYSAEIEALRKVVTGEVQLAAISDLLDHHHQQAVAMWVRVDKVLEHTTEILDRLGRPQ